MSEKVEIFVATHKKFKKFEMEGYIPIQVGAELTDSRFGYLTDNEDDNISSKNRNYCELTALYWAWKNSSANIKGLCHYRRYLTTADVDINSKYFLTSKIIIEDLKKYDMITSHARVLKGRNCRENYLAGQGLERDLNNTQKIIHDICPEYEESYISVLNGNRCIYCNVMISNKNLFDEYCEWLFSILFNLEKITDLREYTPAQARIYGYLSEILLNVWIHKNKIRTKNYSLINTEVNKNIRYYVKLILEKIKLFKILKQLKNGKLI